MAGIINVIFQFFIVIIEQNLSLELRKVRNSVMGIDPFTMLSKSVTLVQK